MTDRRTSAGLHGGQGNLPGKLRRDLSPISVWALSLGCIIGWGSFIMPGTTFLPKAGPAGTALAMGIGALLMVVIAFNYSYMIERYPKAGGEFAYVGESFGRTHAFACSWLLGLCYLALVAQNATALALVARSLFGGVFQTGFSYQVAGFDVYAGELVLALCAIVLFAALSIRGVRFAGVVQTVLVLVIVGGVLATSAAAFVSPRLSPASLSPAFSPHMEALPGVLAVLAVAPFAFVGFDTVPQAAEEYHFPPRKARMLVVISIACGALLYIALNTLAAAAPPLRFANWADYLAQLGSLQGVESLPTFNAASQLLGPAGLWLLGAAVIGATLSGIVGFYMASSRLLFAMGRDSLLPPWFASLHPRWATPRNAILFVCAVSLIAPFFGRTVLGWLVDMSSLGAAVAYGYTSLAAFKNARAEKRRWLMATGLLGSLFSLDFVVLLLVPIPGLSSSLGPESFACLIMWVVLGAVFFAATQKGKEGVPARD